MSPNKEDRKLLKNLHDLAHLTPSEQAIARTMGRTRAALEQTRPRKNILTRFSIPAGIAALLIAAAFIFLSLHSPSPASAAEQLNAAFETTQAYKGWIKVTIEISPEEKKKFLAAQTNPAFTPTSDEYIHTDGSHAYYQNFNNIPQFSLWSIPKKEFMTYRSAENEIHITDMLELQKQQRTAQSAPIDLSTFLANEKKNFGGDPLAVKATPDGPLTRFDITLYASADDAKKVAEQHDMAFLGTSESVWVNDAHLIVRIQRQQPHGPFTFDLTYNIPDIHDLYDLGVPKTAKVIDDRLPKDLTTLMDRLDARTAKGFGNYTAFLASYGLDDNQNPSPTFGYLFLYANHNDQWLATEYRLFESPRPKPLPGFVLQSPLPKWPNADFEKILPLLHDSSPTTYFVLDGNKGSIGWYDTQKKSYSSRRVDPKEYGSLIPDKGLTKNIWPYRLRFYLGTTTHSEILQDSEHPHLLGLHITNSKDHTDDLFWLDPARDDMPIETINSFADMQAKTVITTHIHYTDFAQLPNGEWYPVHWQEDRTDTNKAGKKTASTSHYRLQILPNLILDPSWFQKPNPKFSSPQPLP